jgi:hypothetical protein
MSASSFSFCCLFRSSSSFLSTSFFSPPSIELFPFFSLFSQNVQACLSHLFLSLQVSYVHLTLLSLRIRDFALLHCCLSKHASRISILLRRKVQNYKRSIIGVDWTYFSCEFTTVIKFRRGYIQASRIKW